MMARIQNRMMTVVSGQPPSSKWWCTGAMRNTRRPVMRKLPTCTITDSVSNTNSAPTIGSSSCTLSVNASPARPAPMASAPVSPMNTWAGGAFHHRNPVMAPTMAAAETDRSRASLTSYTFWWRNAQNATTVMVMKA
jgi:hypothetical protein